MDSKHSLSRFNRIILFQGTITLIIFAALTTLGLLFFRSEIRNQILDRDGRLLTDVAQHFYKSINEVGTDFVLLDVALETSEIKNVIAVGLYDPDGDRIASIPNYLVNRAPGSENLDALRSNKPVISYYPRMQMASLFLDVDAVIDEKAYPVTQVLAPLFSADGEFVAIIQYWLDSESVAEELEHMDRFLLVLGCAFILGGGIIFFLVVFVSRQRLLTMGRKLAEQNRRLEKANADLSMAARTSAIGSISSHLFHGLKNPLAGLKSYLQATGHDEEALEVANRMQKLIDDSLSVIREENTLLGESLTMQEFAEVAAKRLGGFHTDRISYSFSGEGTLPAYKAQLLLLIVQNLVDNALEADPNSNISVKFVYGESEFETSIGDDGPGLPEHVRSHLFEPVKSTKENGTGIGLAISSEIARHIPASMDLVSSNSQGTQFKIVLPL